jgi:acetylornithine deacetylase/succinyl-diaminopimelate desuccinylase-like protein
VGGCLLALRKTRIAPWTGPATPGILDLAHQPDEWIGVDDMVDAGKVMALSLHRLLG